LGILRDIDPRDLGWPATSWTVVSALRGAPPTGGGAPARTGRPLRRDDAWESLLEVYRAPMERYVRSVLARRRGRPCSDEEAAEVVQSFVAQAFEKAWLSRADPGRGPFRAYVQVLLRRYAGGLLAHDAARKRRPADGATRVAFDDEAHSPGEPSPAERADEEAFDRDWVATAVERARGRLAIEHPRYRRVIDDLIATEGEGSPDLAAELGVSDAQLRVLRHRARRGFLRRFREELAGTVRGPEEFEAEWRALRRFMP
jgi:hypothetical protein